MRMRHHRRPDRLHRPARTGRWRWLAVLADLSVHLIVVLIVLLATDHAAVCAGNGGQAPRDAVVGAGEVPGPVGPKQFGAGSDD